MFLQTYLRSATPAHELQVIKRAFFLDDVGGVRAVEVKGMSWDAVGERDMGRWLGLWRELSQ